MTDPKTTIEKLVRYTRNGDFAAQAERIEQTEHLKSIVDKLDTHSEPLKKMNSFIEAVRGEPGYSPVKGKDYYTDEEAKDFLEKATPVKDKHYRDGIDGHTPTKEELLQIIEPLIPEPIPGKDAVVDEERIIQAILSKIPKPKNGTPGADGKNPSVKEVVKATLSHLQNLKGSDRPSLKMFREADDLIGSVALHKNMLHNMPKSLIDGDQRWGGHGGSGGTAVWTSGSFTGDNNTTVFTLPAIPSSILFLFINGQRQLVPSDYSLAGATITFTSAPLSTDLITYDFQ